MIAARVSGPNPSSASTLKVDDDQAVVEGDLVDLADPDAGDPDLVALLEPAGLGEGGAVGVAAADQGQVVGPQGCDEQQPQGEEADEPDDHGVALAEGFHPRSHLSEPGW